MWRNYCVGLWLITVVFQFSASNACGQSSGIEPAALASPKFPPQFALMALPSSLGQDQGFAAWPEVTNTLQQKFSWIPKGTFLMGSPATNANHYDDENQVNIEIATSCYLAKTEVTQQQWREVMRSEPWLEFENAPIGNDYPAAGMSWFEAVVFCDKLSAKEGKCYRLPTEAEWEYACRTSQKYTQQKHTELNQCAWFGFEKSPSANPSRTYATVGTKQANRWDLYDMQGNVWEWCGDWYAERLFAGANMRGPEQGRAKVLRGGCYNSSAEQCTTTYRHAATPDSISPTVGFRVVLEVE